MQANPFIFKSNGKLMLTGEYLVLRGAAALALPLKLQQSIEVVTTEANGHPTLAWHAFTPTKPWLKALFELPELDVIFSSAPGSMSKLQMILLTIKQLNKTIFDGTRSYKVITRLDFEPEWGLGTSSTLITNLARWAKVDPYTLLNFSIGGSGYDIAAATAASPFLYKIGQQLKPTVQAVNFKPEFASNLYFVYRGNKKDSSGGVYAFNQRNENRDLTKEVAAIDAITAEAATTQHFERFCTLMDAHETILATLLETAALKEIYPSFKGSLKSLGAWGGDFMMAMTDQGMEYVKDFFGLSTEGIVFHYNDIVR